MNHPSLSIRRRLAEAQGGRCTVPGCGRPSRAATGRGFEPFLCERHDAHLARHGSAWCGSITGPERRPYEAAANAWINATDGDPILVANLAAVADLLTASGEPIPPSALIGVHPERRARAVLASLRDVGVPPAKLLALYLAIAAVLADGQGFAQGRDYRLTQVGKAIHRIHVLGRSGLARYPRSKGRVLWCLGQLVDSACWPLAERHLGAIRELKAQRFGAAPPVRQTTFT